MSTAEAQEGASDDRQALQTALAADLATHAGFGDKVSGSGGDAATAAWIDGRLRGLGYEVRQQDVEVPYFEPIDCRLVADSATAPLYWQSPVIPTEPDGITALLAVVRTPFEAADASGRIALLVLPHARHASIDSPLVAPLVAAAVAAGALALVIVPTGPSNEVVALNAPVDRPPADRPIAVLAPSLAEPFIRAARAGLTATLVLHGRASRRSTPNLIGVLRRGPRWLCLSTPRTGWFTCASERGTGTAAWLAMAGWAVRRFPSLSLLALNTGAHEYRFAGARAVLHHAPDPADTVVWVHLGAALASRGRLDFRGRSIWMRSADPNRFTMATEDLRAAAATAFRGLSGLEEVLSPVEGVSELGAIVDHGYRRAFAALGLPQCFHTPRDGLDTVDAELLVPAVRAHMAVVEAAVRAEETA